MASEDYKKQLKWFTSKMLELRSLEEGYGSSVLFKPEFIESCESPVFDTLTRTPEEHIVRMLKEIRHHLITNRLSSMDELFWSKLSNGSIEIDGYSTELLRAFFRKSFGSTPCLFGEARNERNKTILTYCGRDTEVLLQKNSLAIFRCLLTNFDKEVKTRDLYNSIRNTNDLILGHPLENSIRQTLNKKEKTVVYSAINELKSKLKEATGFSDFPEIIEPVFGTGYKMII